MRLNPNGMLVIQEFLQKGSEESMKELIEFSIEFNMTCDEIAYLAKGLAFSGNVIKQSSYGPFYDIPSTGGPSSLSTLLTPLIISAFGEKVLKLSVPGRPAGGIDCLAQLHGYKIDPTIEELKDWIKAASYIHIEANQYFTPLDIALFNYRKKNNAINIPALVVASILSKKIALGVANVGLDVRVSLYGNFGSNWVEARSNSNLFNNVASLLGINSRCYISNGYIPQQPYIGRGESLLALYQIFNNKETGSLKRHLDHCLSMGISLTKKLPPQLFNGKLLMQEFISNLEIQHSSYANFVEMVQIIEENQLYNLTISKSGFLLIKLDMIRNAIVSIQNKITDSKYPDPCGLILNKTSFEYVHANEVLCSYRCVKRYHLEFEESLKGCFEVYETINHLHELEEIV